MSEAPDIRYGRLLESAHISGYSFERLADELVSLLNGDDWQKVSPGYTDVNAFLRTIDLSPFNLGENRPKLHKRIKELQPKATAKAIGQLTGTPERTAQRDVAPPNGGGGLDGSAEEQEQPKSSPPNGGGRLSGRAAAKIAKKAIAKRVSRIEREAAAEQRRAEPTEPLTVHGAVEIRHGDFREVLADLTDVDAIITDPPYPKEFIPLFGDLSALASKILKPSGVLVVMTGQWWLREYLEELSRQMSYRWTAAYVAQGARTRVHAASVGTGWKPLLVFQRSDAVGVPFLVDDLFDAACGTRDGTDKQHHHWGQSEAGIAEQVERFTTPGALVVDPFLGGGTTAVVCRDLGRRFIGCDIDAACVATARERVG